LVHGRGGVDATSDGRLRPHRAAHRGRAPYGWARQLGARTARGSAHRDRDSTDQKTPTDDHTGRTALGDYESVEHSENVARHISWPTSGNASRVWSINPDAWGFDKNLVGPTVYQPVLLAGQYKDDETVALQNDHSTVHRPGVVVNGFRSYDPWSGSYLQVDPMVESTWSTYVYVASDPAGRNDPVGLKSKLASAMECEDHCAVAGDLAACMALCLGLEDLDPGAAGGLDWSYVGNESACDALINNPCPHPGDPNWPVPPRPPPPPPPPDECDDPSHSPLCNHYKPPAQPPGDWCPRPRRKKLLTIDPELDGRGHPIPGRQAWVCMGAE
jgi:RHS repeat-associated protein